MCKRLIFLLLSLGLVTACTPPPREATPAPAAAQTATPSRPAMSPVASPTEATTTAPAETPEQATATATAETVVATATPPDEPTDEPQVTVNGRTADGAYFLGREDAPVTIIDYSDFL